MSEFPAALRGWRNARRLSQLALPTEAEVSARHLAFLETGRARPSREMVLRLAEALGVPRAGANALLAAAGFAPAFPALPLEAAEMAEVRRAVDWTLERHAPYPGMALDRLWRIVALNGPARLLFGAVGLDVGTSLLTALAEPGGARAAVENWGEVGHHLAARLRTESAAAGGVAVLDRAAAGLAADPEVAAFRPGARQGAVVPTVYRAGGHRLALFSTLAAFGGALEVGASELRIELMFPADAETEACLRALAASA